MNFDPPLHQRNWYDSSSYYYCGISKNPLLLQRKYSFSSYRQYTCSISSNPRMLRRKKCSLIANCHYDISSPYSHHDRSRRNPTNIMDEYRHAWDVYSSMNKENLKSCEQKLIKLDQNELEDYFQQTFFKHRLWDGVLYKNSSECIYTSCVLLHLIHVYYIPGQEQKNKLLKFIINAVLHSLPEREKYNIFERYISQRLKVKMNLTEIDFLNGQIHQCHEFLLKQCYWNKLFSKSYNEDCKEFLKQNANYFVSYIERNLTYYQMDFLIDEQAKRISCKILFCLLNWNISKTKAHQNTVIPDSSSVAPRVDTSINYLYTSFKISNILQKLLTTLSEDNIYTTFNDYLEKMYAMKSEITEDDLCTDMIEPYHEFLLQLCYFEKMCITQDATYREFLRRKADFLVQQIELVVVGKEMKWKNMSCTILLSLLKLNICTMKTIPLVKNSEIQAFPSDASVADPSTKYSCTAKRIKGKLHTLLTTLSEDEIFTAFNYYLEQMFAMNSEITEDDFCTGKIKPYHEFLLKLCYCDKLCNEKDDVTYKEFLKRNTNFLVAQIKEVVRGKKTETTIISCKILLSLLNISICNKRSTTTLMVTISETQASPIFTLVADIPKKLSCTVETITGILQSLLSALSEDEIFTQFNGYLKNLYTMKSEIAKDDLCTGRIEPYYEFMLKLCYCETMYNANDNENCKEFLRRNADLFLSQIEKMVNRNKTKLKNVFCKILLCLLNWNICDLKTPFIESNIQSNEIQESCSFKAEEHETKNSCTSYKVRCVLHNLLSTLTDNDISTVFHDYIDQLYAMKSEITPNGLYLYFGATELNHEFQLKLCYWKTICRKNDNEAYKKFIQLYPEFLVSYMKKEDIQRHGERTKLLFCKTLLCILNWTICNLKIDPILDQNTKIQASSSVVKVADSSTNNDCNAKTIRSILQTVLSNLYEDEIFTAFNDYLDIMYAMNSEITEDDFCTGKIEPYLEFMLKLCYCEKRCNKKNVEETFEEFLKGNAEFLVANIEEILWHFPKTKLISSKVLLLLFKLGICDQKTVYTSLKNVLSKDLNTKPVYEEFMNENAQFFVSMVGTVMKRNNIAILNELCDLLLCTPYNESHFRDVTGAVNKSIIYSAAKVGINDKILEWILLSRYKYVMLLNEYQKQDTAKNIEIDFREFCNLLDNLFTDSLHERKTLDLVINAFKNKIYHYHDCESRYCSCTDISHSYYMPENCLQNYFKKKLDEIRLKELWIDKLKGEVKAIQMANNIRNKDKEVSVIEPENVTPMNRLPLTIRNENFIDEWEADLQINQLNAKIIEAQVLAINMVDEMEKKWKLSEMLVPLMMLLLIGTLDGHHKSAKLKKYLTLKYEYDTAILYLLWCSGDIEVHPGPSLNKKSLAHDSTIERRWIQNISPKILVLLQSKYITAKQVRNDRENRDHLKKNLKKCLEEKVHVPKIYLSEINAWEIMEYKLLHQLFVYRCEYETIITSLQNFLICGGSTNDLIDINVSFDTELKTNEIATVLGKCNTPKDKSQMMVYITRYIAGISIKCAHGKDPDTKCDGLWELALANWPKHIVLFDPNNRGKYSEKPPGQKLIPDQELVDMLLRLPQVTIPPKYKDIVDAFMTMRKSKVHKQAA